MSRIAALESRTPRAGFSLLERYATMPAPLFLVVGVQYVPRTSFRPQVFEMQRLRQARRAAKHLLMQPPYSIPEGDIAYFVECSSFGGFTSQLAPLFYPEEFHAANAAAFSGAVRSMPSDFDSLVYFTSLLGLNRSAHEYTMRDTVEIPMWCRQEQTDFASLSFTNRWVRDHIQRPTHFFIADEDLVTHGTDWINVLSGATRFNQSQPLGGKATRTVFGRTVDVFWTIVSKTTHSDPRPNSFTFHGVTPPVQTDDWTLIQDVMLRKAYDEIIPPLRTIHTIDSYLLSARGHIVRLEINTAFDPVQTGELAGASPLEYGGMRDLDLVTHQGQQRLAALFVPHPSADHAIRFFSTDDCSRVGGFGNVVTVPADDPPMSTVHINPAGDLEPSFVFVEGHGADRYVISCSGELSVWDGTYWLGQKKLNSFAPAADHGCLQAGNIDPSTTEHEVVVGTAAGKVVWFKLSDLTTPGATLTGSDFARTSARFFTDTSTDPNGLVHEHRCNLSLAATWAMAAQPASGMTPGKLRVIDRAGIWWDVDPNGKPTWVDKLPVGTLSLVNANVSAMSSGGGGTPGHKEWQVQTVGASALLRSRPYVPVGSPAESWWLPTGDYRPHVQFESGQPGLSGQWVLPSGGATYFDATTGLTWCAWWQSIGDFRNLIQRVTYSANGSVADIWGSTQDDFSQNGDRPPRWPPGAQGYLNPLRSEFAPMAPMVTQALKIGKVLTNRSVPQVIATCMGGQVLILDGNNGRLITEQGLPKEYPDYGLGGMALALADLTGDGFDEVIFAPLYSPISHLGGTVRSHIHVLTSNAAGDQLVSVAGAAPVPVAGTAIDDFVGYGTCGIAVVDLPTNPPISKAIVVTTLNGELAIFAQNNGVITPAPLFRTVVEGSIGAFGSIVVANLDPGDPKPELYLAGSAGIRRFDFQ